MKKWWMLGLCLLLALCLVSCGEEEKEEANAITVYYVNKEQTGLVQEKYNLVASDSDVVAQIEELLAKLKTKGEDGINRIPIPPDVEIFDFQIKENQLALSFFANYYSYTGIEEILSRAAIVKTLCQLKDIEYVEFYVEDQPLMVNGNAVGLMNGESFVEGLDNNELVQKKQVVLYYANNAGNMLKQLTTTVSYDAAQPLAKLLVERLIAGPQGAEKDTGEYKACIPVNTLVNSITVRDNICYLDLGKGFNELIVDVKSEVVVYSIVNTLCELSNVNWVQFTIDGEQQERYGDLNGFNTPLGRNLDIIETVTISQ